MDTLHDKNLILFLLIKKRKKLLRRIFCMRKYNLRFQNYTLKVFSQDADPYVEKNRFSTFWEIKKTQGSDEDFLETFRPKMSSVTIPIDNEKKVAIAIYKLASCCEYRVVGDVFGVYKITVHKCLYEVVNGLNNLRKEYIQLPKLDEALQIAASFKEKTKMDNIIGCIDGTHIPILAPKKGYKDYVNRKGWTSMVLQTVVDHNYCFRDISMNFPGSVHDAAVFKNSGLYKNAEKLIPKYYKEINGIQTPLMIIGDPACPLLPWLIKPFVGNLKEDEESFNCYLSSARIVVENAFARLKTRWRCLLKRIDIKHSFVPNVVSACCILHNIAEQTFKAQWLEHLEHANTIYPQPSK